MGMEWGNGPEKALGSKELNTYLESGTCPVKFWEERQWKLEAQNGVGSKEKSGSQIQTETENRPSGPS